MTIITWDDEDEVKVSVFVIASVSGWNKNKVFLSSPDGMMENMCLFSHHKQSNTYVCGLNKKYSTLETSPTRQIIFYFQLLLFMEFLHFNWAFLCVNRKWLISLFFDPAMNDMKDMKFLFISFFFWLIKSLCLISRIKFNQESKWRKFDLISISIHPLLQYNEYHEIMEEITFFIKLQTAQNFAKN